MLNKVSASAPGRIDLSGGATDWCGMHTLALAINLRAAVTVERLPNSSEIEIIFGDLQEKYREPEYGTALDLFKAVIELSGVRGIRVIYSTDIPKGSGFGGSAPLTVATLFALNKLFQKNWSLYYIAELAQRAETLKLQTVQGYQDQYSAAFGGLVYMDFNGKACQKGQYSKPIDQEPYTTVEKLDDYYQQMYILAVVPEITRESSNTTNSSLSDRYLNGEPEIVKSMHKKAQLTQQAKKAMIEGDYSQLYDLINQNNEIMNSWGFLSEQNLRVQEEALRHGALAVKTCGAGRAGMAVFAKDQDHRNLLLEKLQPLVNHAFKVELNQGVRYES